MRVQGLNDDEEPVAYAAAKAYLRANGIDPNPKVFTDADFKAIEETITRPTITEVNAPDDAIFDAQAGIYYTEDGEILGEADQGEQTIAVVLEQVGERLAYYNAKKAGLEAERQVYLDRISAAYDSKIKRFEGSINWTQATYTPIAWAFIKGLNAKLKASDKKELRSTTVGLLKIKLNKTRNKIEVEDESLAVQSLRNLYLKEDGPLYGDDDAEEFVEAWIKKTVAKSAIPEEVIESLDVEGIYLVPGGDDTCKLA